MKIRRDGVMETQPVSVATLPLPSGASTEATLSTRLSESTFIGRINTLGQKTMTNSMPVVIASNQTPIPVSITDGASVNKIAYDIQDNVIYIGMADLGAATSAPSWLIKRITLVGGEPTFTEWSSATAIWDNRVIELYT